MTPEEPCDFLSKTPLETIASILRSCGSTSDLLSLSQTCRYIHDVWTSNRANILWSVKFRENPLLEEALISVS